VGDVGQQIALHLHRVLHLLGHVVKVPGKVAQLVVAAVVHLHGVVAQRHLPRGTSLKLGVYTAKGRISAESLGQRLTVSCEVHPIAQCADHGCNVELYLNRDVMELETLGVLARLAPGQSTHHTEFWTLEPLSEG